LDKGNCYFIARKKRARISTGEPTVFEARALVIFEPTPLFGTKITTDKNLLNLFPL
jgi:hypothetical protein